MLALRFLLPVRVQIGGSYFSFYYLSSLLSSLKEKKFLLDKKIKIASHEDGSKIYLEKFKQNSLESNIFYFDYVFYH